MAFRYYSFPRRTEEMLGRDLQELERGRRTITTAAETERGLFYPQDYAFDDPPPPYDEVDKEEPPPLYETLGNYGNHLPDSGAGRRSSTAVNQHSTERASEPRAHERAASYSVYISPDSRSAPPRQESINASVVANISTTLRQMQNYTEEVRERFSDVDLFISSLSLTTPPPSEHRTT